MSINNVPPAIEHHGREYLIGAAGMFAEYFAVRYATAWLAWFAGFLFVLAFYEYTKKRLAAKGRLYRYGSPAFAVFIVVAATLALTRFNREVPPSPTVPLPQAQPIGPPRPAELVASPDSQTIHKATKKITRVTNQHTEGSSGPNVDGNQNVVGSQNIVGNTFVNIGPENATSDQRKKIRIDLGNFMLRGSRLRDRCATDPLDSSLETDSNKWFQEVLDWLTEHLDSSFNAQFSLNRPSAFSPNNVPKERLNLWLGLNQRIEVLDQFITQFK